MSTSRRNFFKGLAAVAAAPAFGISSTPAFGMSRSRQIRRGAKLRVALIGCGKQGRMIINAVLTEKLVAMVDPDPNMFGLMDKEVADLKDAECSANYQGVKKFATYQDMFDAVGDEIDCVIIETPNHQHVLPAIMAMKRGIHTFLDKPLVLTAAEGDLLLKVTKENPHVITQVGTYGHTFPSMKYCVDRIQEGALGDITDVWAYDDRVNSMLFRPAGAPPPKGMNWDLWCGGSPVCEYYPSTEDYNGIHPRDWHSWIGYGNGSIGNLGMHIMDCAFWALDLDKTHPYKVDCLEAKFACRGAWAYRDVIDFHFPEHCGVGPVTLHWWDGLNDGIPYDKEHVTKFGLPHKREWLNIPPIVKEVEKAEGFEKDPFYSNGLLFIGTKGKLWFSHHGGYRFMPRSNGWCMPRLDRPFDFDYRRNTKPHVVGFFNCIKRQEQAVDHFTYGVPLAKTVCLGNIAALAGAGSELFWDGTHVTNNPEADKLVTKEYRKGWDPFAI